MRDGETGDSKHYGFVSFDNFESSDNAIASLNSQYICGRPIEASYAYKKDTKGERHGSAAGNIYIYIYIYIHYIIRANFGG